MYGMCVYTSHEEIFICILAPCIYGMHVYTSHEEIFKPMFCNGSEAMCTSDSHSHGHGHGHGPFIKKQ
jgi:hypothetical protein